MFEKLEIQNLLMSRLEMFRVSRQAFQKIVVGQPSLLFFLSFLSFLVSKAALIFEPVFYRISVQSFFLILCLLFPVSFLSSLSLPLLLSHVYFFPSVSFAIFTFLLLLPSSSLLPDRADGKGLVDLDKQTTSSIFKTATNFLIR